MTITPVRSGQAGALRSYLDALPAEDGPLAGLAGTHFARWLIVSDWVNDPSQPRDDHLDSSYLIFTSYFDGPLDAFLDELCGNRAPVVAEIWGRCVGWPTAAVAASTGWEDVAARQQMKDYLLRNQIKTGLLYSAYPEATVARVKDALATRERLIEFALGAHTLSPTELQRRFRSAVMGVPTAPPTLPEVESEDPAGSARRSGRDRPSQTDNRSQPR